MMLYYNLRFASAIQILRSWTSSKGKLRWSQGRGFERRSPSEGPNLQRIGSKTRSNIKSNGRALYYYQFQYQ